MFLTGGSVADVTDCNFYHIAVGRLAIGSYREAIGTQLSGHAQLIHLCGHLQRTAIGTRTIDSSVWTLTKDVVFPVGFTGFVLYRDGTTHVIFEPEDFIARLAALVPRPRAHLTRYHGVFAPASPDRARIVPRTRAAAANERGETSTTARQPALTWAQRLKRVFAIDIDKSAGLPICTTEGRREAVGHRDVPDETCLQCGGRFRVIARIEQPAVIDRILAHLGREAGAVDPAHPSRAPPRPDRLI